MVIKLGINGFGRIGRVIFRAGIKKADLEIAAINDPAIDVEYICYLIKFDSTHGKFNASVTHTKDEIFVDGCRIKVFHEKLPSNVPWQSVGIQYVIEASGMFTSLEKASGHLASDGIKRVIVTAPSVDVPMVILGVNQDKLNAGQKVISCASSTLYCLAPIVKVLEDCFGVTEGFITSIHAMTPSLKPLDGLCLRGKHWRDHRSIHQNIIPATTGACKALGRIIPRVKDKLSGLAFRVPIVNVSVLDLTIRLNSNTSIHDIIKSVEKASNTNMQNIIKISKEEAVSSDFVGESHSCVLDADSSLQLKPNFYKLVCWYENEYSYACRVIDLIFYTEKQTRINPPTKSISVRTNSSKKKDMVQQTDSCCKRDILSSCSQDTGLKSKHEQARTLIFKRPISSHNTGTIQYTNSSKDAKKSNEMFKVWDDVNEVKKPIRQNRNRFFHNCVAFAPQNREEIECMKAHERLEMLKMEFSKMVNITENLLKRSYTSTLQRKPANKTGNNYEKTNTVKILPEINVEEIKHSCDTFTEVYDNVEKNTQIFDVSGDYKSDISSRNTNTPNEIEGPTEKSTTQGQIRSQKIHYEPRNKLIILEDIPKYKTTYNANRGLPDKILKGQDDMESSTGKNNLETKDAIKYNRIQCFVVESRNIRDNKSTKANAEQSQETEIPKCKKRMVTSDSGFFSLFKPNSASENIQNMQETVKNLVEDNTGIEMLPDGFTNKTMTNDNVSNMEDPETIKDIEDNSAENSPTIAETDTLYNEVQDLSLDTDNFTNNDDKDQTKPSSEDITFNDDKDRNKPSSEDITFNDDKDRNKPSFEDVTFNDDKDRTKPSSEDITKSSTPDPNSTQSDNTSKLASDKTSLVVYNTEFNKFKQDIYDKLDSISGSDSNNSFQANERKSQVINITDLTNSLEDLARLDKICKIIEISDELSNKLFSPLDNCEGIEIKKKKWSFKDLCDKIKLDDFCDKIFGKNS